MPVRGTQSFVHTVGYCWKHPSLVALEVAWRWLYGIPSLALLYYVGTRILAARPLAQTGIFDASLQDVDHVEVALANVWEVLSPALRQAILWLAPLLIAVWSIASGLGRSFVLRRYDPSLPFRPATLIVLQLLRAAGLTACVAGWFRAIQWAANYSLGNGTEGEPNLVLYAALVICISLGIFTAWSLVSWVFSVAPLLALLEGKSVGESLARSLRLGRLKGKLMEINLVLGIVKLGLIVLAMVLSATPLPFESVMTGKALYAWWVFVTLLYLAASDLFQVARLVAFVEFWRGTVEADALAARGKSELAG